MGKRRFFKITTIARARAAASKARYAQKIARAAASENLAMQKHSLRVVKWIGTVPAIGVCTGCATNFKVPLEMLKRTSDAQASLRKQFEAHKCERLDAW
jgi:hypothetical protein